MNISNRLSDTFRKKFVVLIDPDKPSDNEIINIVEKSKNAGVDLTNKDSFMAVVNRVKFLVDELEKLLEE